MLAIAIPAFFLADYWGRRTIVFWGGMLLAGCMAIIGSLYAGNAVLSGHGAGRWIVILLIFILALANVSTWGIVSKTYASEIQPSHTRAMANDLARALNFAS